MKHTIRILCLLLAVGLVLSLCACGKDTADDEGRGNQVGDLCYGYDLRKISHQGSAVSTFDPTESGRVTVINFWAHWCSPCVNELPHFDRVAREYADTVSVIAVHCDTVASAQQFLANGYTDSAITFAVNDHKDPFAYYRILGGNGSVPYTVVLDAQGRITAARVGAMNYDTLVALVEASM